MEEKIFSTDQLREAFYHVDDILGRCLIPFYLFGETGRSMVDNHEIAGNKIEVGVRIAELTEGAKSMLKTLERGEILNLGIADFQETSSGYQWVFKGIPIIIKVIKRKYEFFRHPSTLFYFGEVYNLPNPFDKYYKARFIVQ